MAGSGGCRSTICRKGKKDGDKKDCRRPAECSYHLSSPRIGFLRIWKCMRSNQAFYKSEAFFLNCAFVTGKHIGKFIHKSGKLFNQAISRALGGFIHRNYSNSFPLKNDKGNRG
jgi:hypothetical protein